MGNTTEYVRSKLEMRKTGKGTELEIKIHYVPGEKPFVMVNGNPCQLDGQPNWLAAARFVIQLFEEFKIAVDRERKHETAGSLADA